MKNQHPCDIEGFRKFLKKNGLKATPQRLAVHRAMTSLGHASADMVTLQLEEEGKDFITKASVYNILRELAQLGLYGYRMSRANKMFFDVNAFEHPHVYDLENHVFRDIMDDDLVSIVDDFLGRKKFKGYTIEGIDIQILVKPTRRRYKSATLSAKPQTGSRG